MLRIDKIMRQKGISAQELSKRMEVSPQYVSEVMNEHKNITLTGLQKIANALEVPLAAIFDGYKDVVVEQHTFNCPSCGHRLKVEMLD